jgi:hypothetical protein
MRTAHLRAAHLSRHPPPPLISSPFTQVGLVNLSSYAAHLHLLVVLDSGFQPSRPGLLLCSFRLLILGYIPLISLPFILTSPSRLEPSPPSRLLLLRLDSGLLIAHLVCIRAAVAIGLSTNRDEI